MSDRPYYKAALEKGIGRQVSVSLITNRPTFIIAAPLSPDTGSLGGVVAFALDLDKISTTILGEVPFGGNKIGMGSRAQRFIAIEDGKLLAHSRTGAVAESKKGQLADASSHPLWPLRPRAGEISFASYTDAAGVRWLGAMRQSELGWYMGVEIPHDEVVNLFDESRTRAVGGLVASLSAALALAWFGSVLAVPFFGTGSRRRVLGLSILGLAATLPVVGFGAWELASATTRSEAVSASLLIDEARRSAQKMDSWMETNRVSLETLALTPQLWVQSNNESTRAWAKSRLKLSISHLPWVRASYLINPEGIQTLRSDMEKPVAVGDRKFFKQARVEALGSQVVISRITKLPGLILAKAIKDPEGKFLAEAAYAINADVVTEHVAKDKVGQTGFKFILEKEGGLVAHPRKDQTVPKGDELPVYTEHPLWKARPVGNDVSVARFERDGLRFVGAIARAGNFYVATVLPQDEINIPVEHARFNAILWTLLALALGIVGGFILSGSALRRSVPD